MSRVFNFSPGPAMLPEEVMRQAQEEFMSWHGTGVSVMELSHRSKEFIGVGEAAKQSLREVLQVPSDYHILFMHGGGQGQFAAIPLNLMGGYDRAAYVQTGHWGGLAIKEAKTFCSLDVVASSEDRSFTYIPAQKNWKNSDGAAYLHYVDNETVHGVEFTKPPSKLDIPLVADMSSNILSRPICVSDYGMIYACAQKNLGPAGVTLVLVKDELLLRKAYKKLPRILSYAAQVEKDSMVNTPATFSWYMLGLVSEWVKAQGGLEVMDQRAKARSKILYDYIASTDFYANPVDKAAYSRMNVIFFLKDEALNQHFLQESIEAGMSGLKGHRVLGGMRASMYNAMPEAGAQCLLDFMKDFEKRYG